MSPVVVCVICGERGWIESWDEEDAWMLEHDKTCPGEPRREATLRRYQRRAFGGAFVLLALLAVAGAWMPNLPALQDLDKEPTEPVEPKQLAVAALLTGAIFGVLAVVLRISWPRDEQGGD